MKTNVKMENIYNNPEMERTGSTGSVGIKGIPQA